MPLILSIDTATSTAGVCLQTGDRLLTQQHSIEQKKHALWVHTAIRDIFAGAGYSLKELSAVAVTAGPGSYTGLRVGLATAKGLCYALQVPLITESTLRVMALSAWRRYKGTRDDVLICPMIDARRKEVFTAVYTPHLDELTPPAAMILDNQSFGDVLDDARMLFTGSGSGKWQEICDHPHALFDQGMHAVGDLATLAVRRYREGLFTDPTYAQPVYLKSFYTGA